MTDPKAPRAHIESLERGEGGPKRVHLVLSYSGKEARLELPAGEPLLDQELRSEAVRRELHDLLDALEQVASSPEAISWPFRQRS